MTPLSSGDAAKNPPPADMARLFLLQLESADAQWQQEAEEKAQVRTELHRLQEALADVQKRNSELVQTHKV